MSIISRRSRRLSDRIPMDVRKRAQKAGVDVKDVDWYAGRLDVTTARSAHFSNIPKDELAELEGIAKIQRGDRREERLHRMVRTIGFPFRALRRHLGTGGDSTAEDEFDALLAG